MYNSLRNNRWSLISLFILTLLAAAFPPGSRAEPEGLINTTLKPGQLELTVLVGKELEKDFSVRLVRDGQPVKGAEVFFFFTDFPAKAQGAILGSPRAITGPDGSAFTSITAGDRPGKYRIAAFSAQAPSAPVVLTVNVRKPVWLIVLTFKLLGGVAVFLFGIFFMSDSIQKFGGHRFGEFIDRWTSNRFKALLVGTVVTTVIQSSSATTVIVVSLINSGLMQFSQSIGVILGANIGTTITAQIVAFKLTDYALIFILIGFLVKFISSARKKKLLGDAIIGFGMLFFGMKIMSDVTAPLRTYQPFIDLLLNLENPMVGVLAGGAFTAIIRSSSAATGVYIALSFQGLMPLDAAIPLIFGANIGTSTNALLASIGASRAAKRAALAHVIFNMAQVCAFLPFIPWYRDLIFKISPHPADADFLVGFDQIARYGPRMIANAHTIAKVIAVAIALPFTPALTKLCTLILPVTEKERTLRPKYLSDDLLKYPRRALEVTKKEVLRMGNYTRTMVEMIMRVLKENRPELLDELVTTDENIDILYKEIRPYLSRIGQEELDHEESLEETEIVIVAEELENIGDVISKSMISSLIKCVEDKLRFSELDWEHVKDFHSRIEKSLRNALEAFEKNDLELARKVATRSREMAVYYKALHIAHLQKHHSGVAATIQMSSLYMNLLAEFRQLFTLTVNIANAVIDAREANIE